MAELIKIKLTLCVFGCEVSDDDNDDSDRHHSADDVTCIKQRTRQQQQQQQQQRNEIKLKKRRRIVQVIDSSTEDDLDTSNNNHLRCTPASKSDQNIAQQSEVTADVGDKKHTLPSSRSNRENLHLSEVSRSERPSLIGSGKLDLVKRSVQSVHCETMQPVDCSGSGQVNLLRSGQPTSLNGSVQLTHSKAAEVTECFSGGADFNSVKSDCDIRSSNSAKVMKTSSANDVATFSLAFDDFLDSEEDDGEIIDQVTECTRLKEPSDRTSRLEKPVGNLPDVVISSQVTGACSQTIPQTDCITMSGQLGLIRSGQPSSEPRTVQTVPKTTGFGLFGSGQPSSEPRPVQNVPQTAAFGLIRSGQPSSQSGSVQSRTGSTVSRSFAVTVPQPGCKTGSGQASLSGSQQPGSMTSLEADRLREERIRLSRLKKEEFQRKYASTLTSDQPGTKSPSVSLAADKNPVDDRQSKLGILVDSRELSGAQVSVVQNIILSFMVLCRCLLLRFIVINWTFFY